MSSSNRRCLVSQVVFWLSATLIVVSSLGAVVTAANRDKFPKWSEVERLAQSGIARRNDYRPRDIISKGDVAPIFSSLAKHGWKVKDAKAIMGKMLEDSHFLVKVLREGDGRGFMRKVSRDPAVYDRLDRVAAHDGGKPLIRSLIKLPDGEKYTKAKPGPGSPTMSDLLLINERGSAQRRRLKDYDKPTGRIYTADQFVARLKKSYSQAAKKHGR